MPIEMPDPIHDEVIAPGRAYVRLVEAANFLLKRDPPEVERALLLQLRSLYTRKLREIVGEFPPEITAEILIASDKIFGVVRESSQN